ncbi:phosphonate C-P lyase system protein PhnG [Catenovulum sp. SM1970]|uniref:phosphonate C-P lyase system protein PhnG n=1 Tax=Marinifaba aquimaris TaxID=2741323 RepID=UPI00157254FE|nr:phosphonate C-P lyase system protein PhnG [Marinifaba aquimaris]NTS78860.1 phosphonate C-P lyase system protein PhnG [Marinifaba aquimaris]
MNKELKLPRAQWIKALSQIKRQDLIEQVQTLAKDWFIKPISPPQSGLGVLKMKESTMSEAFFLGEFPLSSVGIEVSTPGGAMAQGAANIMHDDVKYAEALAICDAVLAGKLDGFDEIAALLTQGLSIFEENESARKKILSSTRVDFSLLEDAIGPHDHNTTNNVAKDI